MPLHPPDTTRAQQPPRGLPHCLPELALALAVLVPPLLAWHEPPAASMLAQCVALALWGLAMATLAPTLHKVRGALPLLGALAVLQAAALLSWLWGTLPHSIAALALGMLSATMLVVATGAVVANGPDAARLFTGFVWGLLLLGLGSSAVALIQVFAPGWADGDWIAVSLLPGRAVGNIRQPNQLGSLVLWGLAAAVALHVLQLLQRRWLWLAILPMVLTIELSASRTAAVGLVLLAVWGVVDSRLPRHARVALIAMPVLYLMAWGGMDWWGQLHQQQMGASARLSAEGNAVTASPNSRLNVWRNALVMISSQPWAGVGFGEFNLAWSLTEFAHRPTAFFNHTHNLPLQFLVELGIPAATLVMALLGLALWRSVRQARYAQGSKATLASMALVMVLIMTMYSMVEYPLWYGYFLLPTAMAWGFVLGLPVAAQASARRSPAAAETPSGRSAVGAIAGLLLAAAGVLAILDYRQVSAIYLPAEGNASLANRIARGQLSPLFAHHADYAAATNAVPPASRAVGLVGSLHSLLDARLMMAWVEHLRASGHLDLARWVAQRLRDFNNADANGFFAACASVSIDAALQPLPIQCQAPKVQHSWRELARLPPEVVAEAIPDADKPRDPVSASR